MPKKGCFEKNKMIINKNQSLTILLASPLVFACFHLEFQQAWLPQRRGRCLIFLFGLYMFLYILVKHVVNIQTLLLQGGWEKFATLSLVYEKLGIERETYGVKKNCAGL